MGWYLGLTVVLCLLITVACVLPVLVPAALVPMLLVFAGCSLIAGAWLFLAWKRCPSCRRFFARGPLHQEGSYTNTTSVRLSTGGTAQRTNRVTVYKTRCRHGGHTWRVLR